MQKLCQTWLALNGWNHLFQPSGFVLQEELENVWLRPGSSICRIHWKPAR